MREVPISKQTSSSFLPPDTRHSALCPFLSSAFCLLYICLSESRGDVNEPWPMGHIWPAAWFWKHSFPGTQPCPFIYIGSEAALAPLWQIGVVATQTIWPMKPKICTVWACTEACQPLFLMMFC